MTKPIENRIKFILETKTDNVALRLRLLRPLFEDKAMRSDARYSKARAKYSRACVACSTVHAEYNKAYEAAFNKAYAGYSNAYAEYSGAAEPHYHRLFPDSPWNGKTIFAGEFAL